MLAHLERHRREHGHLVPQHVLDELGREETWEDRGLCPRTGRPHVFDPGPGLGTGPRLCLDCGAEWEGPE